MTEIVKLGDLARDVMTGFEGHVVARTEWLHGCARLGLEPAKLDKDGKTVDSQWFDEPRVELVEARAVPNTNAETRPGGPRRDPTGPR